jgi:hypothetical protein
MKFAPNKILSLVLFFNGTIVCLAQDPPNPSGGPPVDLPIDDNLYILFALALILGIYYIYKHKLNKKTPI